MTQVLYKKPSVTLLNTEDTPNKSKIQINDNLIIEVPSTPGMKQSSPQINRKGVLASGLAYSSNAPVVLPSFPKIGVAVRNSFLHINGLASAPQVFDIILNLTFTVKYASVIISAFGI
jgi:hypothetical protein